MVCSSNQNLVSASKVHLIDLIATLKSELATTNELLVRKSADYKDAIVRLNDGETQLLTAHNRIQTLENEKTHHAKRHSTFVQGESEQSSFAVNHNQKAKTLNQKLKWHRAHTRFLFEQQMSTVNAINSIHNDQDNVTVDVLGEYLRHAFDENIKLNRMANLLRDENLNWRHKYHELRIDYDLLNESHKKYIMVTLQHEYDLLHELSSEIDECMTAQQCFLDEYPVVAKLHRRLLELEDDFKLKLKVHSVFYYQQLTKRFAGEKPMDDKHKVTDRTVSLDAGDDTDNGGHERHGNKVKELMAQIQQMRQAMQDKELTMQKNEISSNLKIESAHNKIEYVQKQNDCLKRQNETLMLNIRDLQNHVRNFETTCVCRYHTNELRLLNGDPVQRTEWQNLEYQKINNKLQLSASLNTQLNDELNEKTEQICQLHSTNTKLTNEIGKCETELRRLLDNEKRMTDQCAADRESTERTKKALDDCEATLKSVTENHDKAIDRIHILAEQNQKLQNTLTESQKQLLVAKHECGQMHAGLKEMKGRLNAAKEKVHDYVVLKRMLGEMQSENTKLTNDFNEKCDQLTAHDVKHKNLEQKYDSLHVDYENLLEIKSNAENTLQTAREWQREQRQHDEMIHKKIAMQTEHIRTLLDDRQSLIAKNGDLLRDSLILRKEIERLKGSPPLNGLIPSMFRCGSDSEINEQLIDSNSIKRATRNIQRIRSFWENGMKSVEMQSSF